MESDIKKNAFDTVVELLFGGFESKQISEELKKQNIEPNSKRWIGKKIAGLKKEYGATTSFELGSKMMNYRWIQKLDTFINMALRDGREEGYSEGFDAAKTIYRKKGRCQGAIWTTIILTILFTLFTVFVTYGQDEINDDFWYISGTFDPNQSFGWIDNPRTKTESFGFDYDVEAGVRYNHFGVYLTYGAFQEINYQNYAAGVDYYVNWIEDVEAFLYNPFNGKRKQVIHGISLSVGINYGVVMRADYEGRWGAMNAGAIRAITTVWILEDVGIVFKLQGQQRPDLPELKSGVILEGSWGIIYKFDRKPIINRFQ